MTRHTKILLVSPFTSTSGSAIRFWNIALQLKMRGFEVIYIDRNDRSTGPLYHSTDIRYFPSSSFSPLVFDILYSTLFNIVMLLRNRDAAIFYALKPAPNNCIPALLARLLGKKVLLDIDDLDYEYLDPGLKKALARFFFKLFPRFFPLVTCHTPNLVAYCRDRLRLHEDRLYYLAQGVSAEFLKIRLDDSPSSAVNATSILYVATLGISSEFSDALPMLASICKRHPQVKITVVGDGIRRSLFEATAHKLGIADCVIFAGRIPHAQLPEEMAKHTIGINYMRSSSVNECRAILKIREYLACGLQVVCNKCGDAELFAKVAFVEDDLDAMEGRLDMLLSNPVRRNVQGRSFIEQNFSWQPIISHFVAYLPEKKILPREAAV